MPGEHRLSRYKHVRHSRGPRADGFYYAAFCNMLRLEESGYPMYFITLLFVICYDWKDQAIRCMGNVVFIIGFDAKQLIVHLYVFRLIGHAVFPYAQ